MAKAGRLESIPLEEIARMTADFAGIDPLALHAYNELQRAARTVVAALDRAAVQRGRRLSVGRNAVLWSVCRYPDANGITPAEIAAALDVTRATVTGLLSGLAKDGLIERVPSKIDRRKTHIRPTAKARDSIASEWPEMSRDISRVLGDLSEKDMARFVAILHKICQGAGELG